MSVVLAFALASGRALAVEQCNGTDDDGDGLVDEPPVVLAPDGDGDGWGSARDAELAEACPDQPLPAQLADLADCDDHDAEVNPGAREQCNAVDDDCDGQIDEVRCGRLRVADGERALLLRLDRQTWLDARDRCSEHGWHLATLEDRDQQALVLELSAPFDAWIGLDDREIEGEYVWLDGSALDPQLAAWREPPDDGAGLRSEDCVELDRDAWAWNDDVCSDRQASLCERECVPTPWYADPDGDGLGSGPPTVACAPPAGWAANALGDALPVDTDTGAGDGDNGDGGRAHRPDRLASGSCGCAQPGSGRAAWIGAVCAILARRRSAGASRAR
jgi:hypothetical protein